METSLQQSVFVDRSAWMAYMDPGHPYYHRARTYFRELDDLDRSFVTTNQVVFALHQWLRDRYGYMHASYFLNVIDKSVHKNRLRVILGDPRYEAQAKQLIEQHDKYEISLEEALNAVVISDYEIRRVFTFNQKYAFLTRLHDNIRIFPGV